MLVLEPRRIHRRAQLIPMYRLSGRRRTGSDALLPPSRVLILKIVREKRIMCSARGARSRRHRQLVQAVCCRKQSVAKQRLIETIARNVQELVVKSPTGLKRSAQRTLRSKSGSSVHLQAPLRQLGLDPRVMSVPFRKRSGVPLCTTLSPAVSLCTQRDEDRVRRWLC